MVGRGWGHDELMSMSEGDFAYWLGEQIAYDRTMAEARAKAAAKAARR